MFILDIHRAGADDQHDDAALFDRLIAIRNKYPALLARTTKQAGEIQSVFSKAACQVRSTAEQDSDALDLFQEYLAVFCEMVEKATPLAGEVLDNAKQAYERYLKTVVDHDPGVNGYKKLFGKQSGLVRALDIFFAH